MIFTELIELLAKLIALAVVFLSVLMFVFAAVLLAIDNMLERKRQIKQ